MISLRSFSVLLTMVLLANPSEAWPPTVRVGTWNMHWLGRPDRRGRGGVAQKAEDIAKYIQASGCSILGLNEVSANEGTNAAPTNKTLTEALKLLKEKTGEEWKHVLFLRDDPNDKDLLTGVAWNTKKVTLQGAPFKVPIRRSREWVSIWNRPPYAVKFSTGTGKTDLVVIPVHLKSNVGGVLKTGKQRAQEARMLIRSLGQVQIKFSDDDVVILGDFNTRLGSEESQYRFAVSGFRDLNSGDQMTWIKDNRYPPAPFDRILVPGDQPEHKESKQIVFKGHHLGTEEEYRKLLSDHYLVYTEIKIMDDDD